jgi:arsenate reductase (thioredoxin)
MEKKRVLFLCTGNSARSQMAEALLNKYGGKDFIASSAGLNPTVINPYTIKVLEEVGIDTSDQFAKPLETFIGKLEFDYLITVCSSAEKRCPMFPGMGTKIHWPFEDPSEFKGSDSEKMETFREIRNKIETRIKSWLIDLAE